ncbi:MAG: GHKL domain-containing protein [Lachnospiraceae bacterium]|nr:GHKL domain-containing protein [Lachnospiraceae bacterium]
MTDALDFFNSYIMGSAQLLTGFHFFAAFLQTKVKPAHYFLFAVSGIVMMTLIPAGSMAVFPAYILLLAADGIFICKAHHMTAALYAVVTAAIMQLCYGIFDSALYLLSPLMSSFPQKPVGIAFMLLGNLALPAAIFCCHVVYKFFLFDQPLRIRYALLILTPIFLISLMAEYISSIFYGNTTTIYGVKNPANAVFCRILSIQLLSMASLFCVMLSYKKLLENFDLNTEFSLLKQEEHALHLYVKETKTRYEKTKSFRHDLKNHLSLIKEFLQSGNVSQALQYIDDMEDIAEAMAFPCSTNHPMADILIGNKLGIAKDLGIDVCCRLLLPSPCSVRGIDLCIILSNALDNAIHACENMEESASKYIHLSGRMQGDFLLLEAENSFQGKDSFQEGTGLSNIRAIAEKYHGAVSITAQNSVFVLSVLLIIPQQLDSISRQSSSSAAPACRKRT